MAIKASRVKAKPNQAASPRSVRAASVPDAGDFKILFRSMQQGAFYQAADGALLDVNPAALKMLGLTRREFLCRDSSHPRWKVVREDGTLLPGPKHPSMVALRTGKPVRDFVLGLPHGRTGKTVWLSVSAIPEFRPGAKRPFRVAVTLHDLTAMKRSELDLRASEARFRGLFERSPIGIGLADRACRFVDLNPAFANMLGYGRKELIGRNVLDLTHPDDRAVTARRFGRVIRGTDPGYQAEKRYFKKSGEIVWVRVTTVPVLDSDGEFLYGLGLVEDISKSRAAEDRILKAQDRYRGLFENIRDAVAVYEAIDGGRDFLIRDFNPAAEKIEKVPREQLLGRRVTEAFPGVKRFGLLDVFRRVWKTGRTEFFPAHVYRDKRDPGTWRENWVYRLPGGEVVAVYRDITESKRTEAALRESEDKFKYLFDHSIVGKTITQIDGSLQANAAFGAMLGYSAEAVGRLRWQEITHPEDIALTQAVVDDLIAGRKKSARFLKRYLHRSGAVVWAEVTTVLRRDPSGKPLYLFSTIMDMTERVRSEETVRESEARFRSLFNAMTEMAVLHEVVRDAGGRIVDYRILDANPAFQATTGLHLEEERGRLASQVYGTGTPPYLETYAAVVEEGRSRTFETYFAPMDRHFAVSAVPLSSERFATITTDITAPKRAEEEIRRSLREKEILLREVFHRTKNNMNVVASMLSLRARTVGDPAAAAALRDVEDRIRVMALVHRKLYETRDLSHLDLKDYVGELADQLQASHRGSGPALSVDLDLRPIRVPIDAAIPCGMILCELFANAAKHAYRGAESGRIRIRLAPLKGGEIELEFADDGAGLPAGFDPSAQASLGLQTVLMLVEHQLQGRIDFESGAGLACRIRFPLKSADPESPS